MKNVIYEASYPANPDDAVAERKLAERKYNFHPNHGKQLQEIKIEHRAAEILRGIA